MRRKSAILPFSLAFGARFWVVASIEAIAFIFLSEELR